MDALLEFYHSKFDAKSAFVVFKKRWLRFSFLPFWHYDLLRGRDHPRNAGIKPDSRVSEAIENVLSGALAVQSPSEHIPFGDGDGHQPGKLLEHNLRAPNSALVQQYLAWR
jgi:hypothetical protein